jgi:hypothetical protein
MMELRRDRLKDELAAMTAQRDAFERLCIKQADRAELAERQVAVLCGGLARHKKCRDCNLFAECREDGEKIASCNERLAAWSRAEAAKGGKE